jgi:hypothetical protein
VDLAGGGHLPDARTAKGHGAAEQDGLLRDAGGEPGRLRVLAHQGPAVAQDALAAARRQHHLQHQAPTALLRRRRQPQLGQPLGRARQLQGPLQPQLPRRQTILRAGNQVRFFSTSKIQIFWPFESI